MSEDRIPEGAITRDEVAELACSSVTSSLSIHFPSPLGRRSPILRSEYGFFSRSGFSHTMPASPSLLFIVGSSRCAGHISERIRPDSCSSRGTDSVSVSF